MTTHRVHRLRVLRRRRGESGQAILETAMVLPLLAAVILIFVAFGKALYYYIDLTHVSNEGAREAAVNLPNGTTPLPGGATSLKTYLCNQLTGELHSGSGTVTAAAVTISYPDTSSSTPRAVGEPVKINVSTNYHWFPFMNLGTFSITGSTTMRLEQDTSSNTSLAPGTSTCP